MSRVYKHSAFYILSEFTCVCPIPRKNSCLNRKKNFRLNRKKNFRSNLTMNSWKANNFRSNVQEENCFVEVQNRCLNGQVANECYCRVPGSCSTLTEPAGCYWAGNSYGCCLPVVKPSYCYSVHCLKAANSGILEKYIPGPNADGCIQVKYMTEDYDLCLHYSGFVRLDSDYSGSATCTDTCVAAAHCC
jgi:hypothetical protein